MVKPERKNKYINLNHELLKSNFNLYPNSRGTKKNRSLPCGKKNRRVRSKHKIGCMFYPDIVLKKQIESYNNKNMLKFWKLLSPDYRNLYKNSYENFLKLLPMIKISNDHTLFNSNTKLKIISNKYIDHCTFTSIVIDTSTNEKFNFILKRQYKQDPKNKSIKKNLDNHYLYKPNLLWWRTEIIKQHIN